MGDGHYSWKNGDYYEGSFLNDTLQGKGCYHWENGDKVEGFWMNNKINGEAVFKNNQKECVVHFVNRRLSY